MPPLVSFLSRDQNICFDIKPKTLVVSRNKSLTPFPKGKTRNFTFSFVIRVESERATSALDFSGARERARNWASDFQLCLSYYGLDIYILFCSLVFARSYTSLAPNSLSRDFCIDKQVLRCDSAADLLDFYYIY